MQNRAIINKTIRVTLHRFDSTYQYKTFASNQLKKNKIKLSTLNIVERLHNDKKHSLIRDIMIAALRF